jgi:hypothetical protein
MFLIAPAPSDWQAGTVLAGKERAMRSPMNPTKEKNDDDIT